jgi:adenosylcobyric acid synthase
VLESLADLRSRYDVVVCEGAGSPAEINLRDGDLANMGLARAAGLPVIVVGDIDRGGVFAALYGTVALMPPADQRLVAGFLINKFRGDVRLLQPGLDRLVQLTNRPVYGVLPWLDGLWLDVEDSLDLGSYADSADADALRVAVVRLPRISNFTDIDALAAEPHVSVRFTTAPVDVADADLVVLPGTRATVADLQWLRERGLADALVTRAAKGRPVLGICGGYQMLGATITDAVESDSGSVAGLGILPVTTVFAEHKTLGRPAGVAADGAAVSAYEIHHGVVTAGGGEPLFTTESGAEGCRVGATWGTVWHGVLENDDFRRAFLAEVARAAGREFRPGGVAFADARQQRLDALADHIAANLDMAAVVDVITSAG